MKSKSNSTVVKSDTIKSDESTSKSKLSQLVKKIIDLIKNSDKALFIIEAVAAVLISVGCIAAEVLALLN